ncbi:protein mono-ADP-ribosyltransferase PARP12 [Amia ocellicauda]|uniref:protein mono-ADP-ribosyltransferase PARP12 n=1 Tax=Amia ocellicauda TaxID=2972642 RepID=UPI003464D477
MSAAAVSNYATKVLCSNRGCLEYRQLQRRLSPALAVSDARLCEVLRDGGRFVVVPGAQDRIPGCPLSPDSTILAKTSVRLCKSYPNCGRCENLHLCRYYVCGNCRYSKGRNTCRNSHDFRSDHNLAILTSNQLQDLEEAELFQLLLQNDSYLLPEICPHYNKGNGQYGSCTFKMKCTNLHVCQHFLQGDCKFGAGCKRCHRFDLNARNILSGRGLSADNTCILHDIYKNRYRIDTCVEKTEGKTQRSREPSLSSTTDVDSNEICLFFLRKHCSFKEKCIRVHFHLPYKWEVLDRDGLTWKELPQMEDIEKAYCNPENTTSNGSPAVNFLTMTCRSAQVRRLSTASSVTKPPHFLFTTEWVWYWKNEHGKWTEYGHQQDEKAGGSISSKVLENVYLADSENNVPFSIGGQQYILHFKGMYQQNQIYKTKREVQRRPRFVSAQDVERKLKSGPTETTASTAVSVPAHWDQGALPDFTYKLISLSTSSEEFRQVEILFRRTMLTNKIHKIQRIQNPSLWKVFQWQKEQMKKRNGGKAVDERFLFHGTEQSLISAICEQNFDWRICGIHGTLYGKGSYFARDASYSHNYSKPQTNSRIMFVARVLVGDFIQGNNSYLRPPVKEGNAVFYDSCVNSMSNPSIFVIFEKHQVYPEYLVEYS